MVEKRNKPHGRAKEKVNGGGNGEELILGDQ